MEAEIVSLSEREALLRNLPFFRTWSITEIATLAGLMQEIHVNTGFVIVKENAFIDAIYFIVDGEAEVTKEIQFKEKSGTSFLALLNNGECIGLKEAGLFSESGERTATVTAVAPTLLLKLELEHFHHFLKEHPHLLPLIDSSLTEMLKMRLIKNAAPFAKLTNQKIAWMATQVREVTLPEQTIIFKEGDNTDSCFMVYEGNVEIVKHDKQGHEKLITVLTPGILFGEAALLTDEKRNATARTQTPSKLLVMEKDMLQAVFKQEEETSDVLISLLVERSRPIRKEKILFQQKNFSDGQFMVVLKDPETNNYYQLNEKGWYLWQILNGQSTATEITRKIQNKFAGRSAEESLEILTQLIEQGFVNMDALQDDELHTPKSAHEGRFKFSYLLKNADRKVTFLYKRLGFLFFYIPMVALLTLFSFSGIYFFAASTGPLIQSLKTISNVPLLVFLAFICTLFYKLFNPIFKMLTIKHFKHEVPHAGFVWKGLTPKILLDTSDMIIAKRWPKTAVECAGLLAYLLIAAILSLQAWTHSIEQQGMGLFFWLSAFFMYMEILRALDPMVDLEGYILFIESLNTANLREIAFKWISGLYSGQSIKNKNFILYFWAASCLYLGLLLLVTALFFNLIEPLLPPFRNFLLIALGLVTIGFIIEIILTLRRQKKLLLLAETV